MKRVIFLLIAIIIIGLLIYRFAERRRIVTTRTIAQIQAQEGYPVEVENVEMGTFNLTRKYTGTVVGGKQSVVVSMLSEHISEVFVRQGQFVEKDAVICELSRNNPSASYAKAKLASENAERELARVQALYNEGAISEQVLDAAQMQRDMTVEALKTTEQLLYLCAPIAGIVTELEAEVGKLIAPGQPVAKIVSTEKARVEIQIPARDRDMIKINAPCTISNDGNSASGKVERVSLSANPENRSFTAWITFSERQKRLVFSPGLLVDVNINVLNAENVTIVTPDALMRKGERWFIYALDGDNVRLREIELGGVNHDIAWIRSGVALDEQVITSGASLLFEGAPVRIIHRNNNRVD